MEGLAGDEPSPSSEASRRLAAEQIQQLNEISGLDYIMLWTETGGMSHIK